jgi:hypothetical protein
MSEPLAVRDALTLGLLAVGGYCLIRCVLPDPRGAAHGYRHLFSSGTHLVMSAAMLGMVWRTVGDRWGVQLSFFAVGGGCYAVRAARLRRADGAARLGLLHEAVAMAAMFWMVWAVAAPTGSPVVGAASMGMSDAGTGIPAPAVTLALAGYLGLAALWWLHRARVLVVAQPGPAVGGWLSAAGGRVVGRAGDAACQAVLAVAAAVLLMRML